ncbi:MAG: polysaccharide export protein [Phenylobacterium sp.]|jgi:polysaccharide export outer membrane protein|nr:polysaccharide export protein [Phenylobacterium sp.]
METRTMRMDNALSIGLAMWLAWSIPSQAADAPRSPPFADVPFASWDEAEPPYRLYPGDELELTVPSAPELNKTLVVQPDGRIAAPLLDPVMVADLPLQEAAARLSEGYAAQLLRPAVSLNVKAAPIRVFVGGQVDKPGVYEMVGDMTAMQALIMAGGVRPSARGGEAIVIRRGADSVAMIRRVDLTRVLRDPYADAIPLRRLDIIYVPRSRISELGDLMQQLRGLLPFQFTYALSPTFRGY